MKRENNSCFKNPFTNTCSKTQNRDNKIKKALKIFYSREAVSLIKAVLQKQDLLGHFIPAEFPKFLLGNGGVPVVLAVRVPPAHGTHNDGCTMYCTVVCSVVDPCIRGGPRQSCSLVDLWAHSSHVQLWPMQSCSVTARWAHSSHVQ
jgi:hypothetical protein